jgi:hypothetical protein
MAAATRRVGQLRRNHSRGLISEVVTSRILHRGEGRHHVDGDGRRPPRSSRHGCSDRPARTGATCTVTARSYEFGIFRSRGWSACSADEAGTEL